MNKYLILTFLFLIGCGDNVNSSTDTSPDQEICGNEIIEKNEECDELSDHCENCIVTERKIFVTSYGSNGKTISPLRCDLLSKSANLDRGFIWYPWISIPGFDIKDNIFNSPYPYKLVDGTIIADNFEDLIDGDIQNPINLSEENKTINNADVWTGTDEFGKSTGIDCSNWSLGTINEQGTFGNTSLFGKQWTNYKTASCDNEFRIYCIES